MVLASLVKVQTARRVACVALRAVEVLAERLVAQEPLWVTLSATEAERVEHTAG